ncbi:MAG: hypothetical protein U0575_14735 [Phycisphaerales bacterium]
MARLFRLGMIAAVFGGMALGVWFWLTSNQAATLARQLAQLQAEMDARVAERDAMIARLGRSHRKGIVEVLGQKVDEHGKIVETEVRFIEVDDQGRELGRVNAKIPGDTVFIDAWSVKFEGRLVAEGHPLMGRSLVLLRRIYSDRMAPMDGVPIDTPGAVPNGYAASDMAKFEQKLWESFWRISTDPALAKAFGVRVAQGEAVYRPVVTGQRYELTVDAAGGMNLVPAS